MSATYPLAYYLRKQIAIPQDHGSWVFILSPLLIGLFAGYQLSPASFLLVEAALCAFLSRQPITIAIKVYSGRRPRRDLPAAWFWIVVYALIGFFAVFGLVIQDYGFILLLAVPGVPVFIWHLWLVSRREERRQMGVELVATCVLSLSAPAAYWVGVGSYNPLGWWLFILTWFQSAASIVYAYLRLEQRSLPTIPNFPDRLRLGWRALTYTNFNFGFVLVLTNMAILPAWLWVPYLVQAAETWYGTLWPAIGVKPTRIGIRQLVVSSLFTVLFIITWNIQT